MVWMEPYMCKEQYHFNDNGDYWEILETWLINKN